MAFARHVSDGPKQGAIEGLIYPVRTRGSSLEHAMDMDTLYIYILHIIYYTYAHIFLYGKLLLGAMSFKKFTG